jgi:uncharacterized protein DUF4326
MPERIQLKRTKGWKMPPNTVKVDRSTPWGNPWPIGKCGPLGRTAFDALGAVGFFEAMFTDPDMKAAAGYPDGLGLLAGKNLACWCPLTQPCHADVLLKIANSVPQTGLKDG